MNSTDAAILTELVEAIPISQPLYTNDFMVGCLMVCGLVLAAVMSDRKNFLARLLKGFFLPRESAFDSQRTANTAYMRMGMYAVAAFSVGLLLTVYTEDASLLMADTILLWLMITFGVVLLYLVKMLLFVITDSIFLEKPIRMAWERSYADWTILAGIPLYFAAIAVVFFDLVPSTIPLILGACVILLELCLLYKAFYIFSGKRYGVLQLFVYLCTLELIPLLLVGKALVLFV